MNKDGVAIAPGGDDAFANTSSLVSDEITLPAYSHPAIWNEVVACFRHALALYNVEVVEVDPGDTQHTEIVFTTDSFLDGAVLYGVASWNCDRASSNPDRPMAFVFGSSLGEDVELTCDTAVSSFGGVAAALDHTVDCRDWMAYQGHCDQGEPREWVNEEIACGELDPRECHCSGAPTQNSHQQLLNKLGAACRQ